MPKPTTYGELVDGIIEIISLIIPVLFALVFIYFVWKIIDSWILNVGDAKKREEGRSYAIAAVVAFVAMVSVWGLVTFVRTSLFGV